jgi:hypothetical protein
MSMADAKRCPDCSKPLRLYDVRSPVQESGLIAGAEIIQCIVVVVLPISFWALGTTGLPLAIAGALIAIVAALWNPYAKAQRRNEDQFGLYYCEACDSHFQGSALRRITEAEAKRAS